MNNTRKIIVNENHSLFDKTGMFYKEFTSDFRLVRYNTRLLIQKAPPFIRDYNLMEQQISEIIKNAVTHGNKRDPEKIVKVWYLYAEETVRFIIEDEGEGFQELDSWNEFNKKKDELYYQKDFLRMADYVSFRGKNSTTEDGGNALFAAVEYWNLGMVFNSRKNTVALGRRIRNENGLMLELRFDEDKAV
jgi:serine/threonine-protein kinase RsbW